MSDVTGPSSSTSAPPPPGKVGSTVAGRYRIERELARGGMGAVYVAFDEKFSQRVALKLSEGGATQYAQFKARFRREAEIGNRLGRVEGFVRALDWGEIAGSSYLYLTMDLIEGAKPLDLASGTLQDRLRRLRRAVRIVAAAHKQHVIHRDLKPANFLQAADGTVHLTDFGLSKVHGEDAQAEDVTIAGEELTQSGTGMGTPLYMPPEQFEDAATVDERADVYALGVMLFFALTGRHPFPGGSFQTLWIAQQKVLEGKSPAPSAMRVDPSIPAELDLLCTRAIALNLEQRLRTAEELQRGLDAALGATGRATDPTLIEKSAVGVSLGGSAPTGADHTPRVPPTLPDQGHHTTRGLAPTVTPGASGRVSTTQAPSERRRGPGLLLAAALVAVGFGAWVVSRKTPSTDRPPLSTTTERTTTTTSEVPIIPTATEATVPTVTEPTTTTTTTEPVPTTTTEPTTPTEPVPATSTEPVPATTTEPVAPPPPPLALIVTSPTEVASVTSSAKVELRGKIDHWATARDRPRLLLDGAPVDVAADGSFLASRELLRDGQHTLELALEGGPVERRTITLDRAPPALDLRQVPSRTTDAQVTLRGTAAGAVSFTVAGRPVTLAADGTFDVTLPLLPGQNSFEVVALDSVANRAAQRLDLVRAPWARIGLLAALPAQPATDLLHLANGARVPRGTRVKVGVQLSARAAVWVVEARGGLQNVLRGPRRPGRLEPSDTDLLVPNKRGEWLVLATPGEVELVVTLTSSTSPAWTADLAPPAREAPGAALPDDATELLLVTQDGAGVHRLTPLWLQDGADGLTWRVRLTVE